MLQDKDTRKRVLITSSRLVSKVLTKNKNGRDAFYLQAAKIHLSIPWHKVSNAHQEYLVLPNTCFIGKFIILTLFFLKSSAAETKQTP